MGAKPSTPIHDSAIYEVPLNALVPYADNPRIGDVGAIAESLVANGQYRPIVVRRESREILAGNHTFEAARHLGWETIAVTYVENLTDEQAARIVLADNRLPDLGRYNAPDLTALLESLPSLEGTGYDDYSVSALLAEMKAEAAIPAEPLPADEDWAAALSGLGAERTEMRTMTFTFHESQQALVQEAIKVANQMGDYDQGLNPNKNGNALARICRAFMASRTAGEADE